MIIKEVIDRLAKKGYSAHKIHSTLKDRGYRASLIAIQRYLNESIAEQNPRADRYLPIVKKVADETQRFLTEEVPENKITIRERVKEVFFRPTQNDEDIDSALGTVSRFKDNNIYAFMVDAVSLFRARSVLEDFGFDVPEYDEFFLGEYQDRFPYVSKLIRKRKFESAEYYVDALYHMNQMSFFELVDHIDDMLQMPGVRAEVKRAGLIPPTTTTLNDIEALRLFLNQLSKKEERPASSGLKEVQWESIKDKKFDSPLTAKRPPYEGVIPAGTTFVEGPDFKWVDISYSNVYTILKNENENTLFAPYESFYVRHCGRDRGNRLLSLRIKTGDGWFPIAMATLRKKGGAYNEFQITQLKTYANQLYWSPDAQARSWLLARGIVVSDIKDNRLKDMVKALLLDPRISIIFNSSDLNIGVFKDEPKISEKLKEELKKFIMFEPTTVPRIARVHDLLESIGVGEFSVSIDPVFEEVYEWLENLALNHFVALLKVHFPEFNGEVKLEIRRTGTGKTIHYIIKIKSFSDIIDAENFYWHQFPNLKQEHGVGSGDPVRYSTNMNTYTERMVYGAPPENVKLFVIFRFNEVSLHYIEESLVEEIKRFRRRWKDYYEKAAKNPKIKVRLKRK